MSSSHRKRAKHVGYDRGFLDAYRPNTSSYLSEQERAHLATVGRPQIAEQPAGTFAKQILSRLLIDLAWNSSRLEGNTYSLLDTKRLIELGQEAEGRAHLEAQMILNHKDAIEFLVSEVDEIGFNRYTILNLHALLANNLLADPTATGELRTLLSKDIGRSTSSPRGAADHRRMLRPNPGNRRRDQESIRASLLHHGAVFPYLQPFDDVNKRVSRLAANIPLIKSNLSPLSLRMFRDRHTQRPSSAYTK